MSFFSDILSGVNLGSNWLLILVFLVAGAALGFLTGKNRLCLVVFSGYISFLISSSVPWGLFLAPKNLPDTNIQVFIFLAIILAIFFVAPFTGLAGVIKLSGRGRAGWWQLIFLGICEIGFLTSAVISFNAKSLGDLSPFFRQFFSDQPAQFIWLVLPLIAMLLLKKRKSYSYSDSD